MWKEKQGFGWGIGPLANKVWIQPDWGMGPLANKVWVVHLGLVGTRISAGFCDHRWVGHELRLSRPAFASSSRQGVAVERACTATCMQAKFGYIESARCAYRLACEEANEQ